jgi:predicted kinase
MRLSEELFGGLFEAKRAKPGEKRERKDGYTWQRQDYGKEPAWIRLGKTADLKKQEQEGLSAGAALKAKDEPVPKGRQWIDHLPGMPKNTSKAHKDPQTGEYTPERQALHKKIIDSFLNEGFDSTDEKKVVPKKVPPSEKPVSLFMMGTTASGKSTARAQVDINVFDKYSAVVVDPDAIKEMLPEYQQSVAASAKDAAWICHDESSDIAKKINAEALKQNKNVIVDGTGKNLEKMQKKINNSRNSGYHISALMPHVPYEDCVKRADDRAEKKGRYVPHEIIKECADHVGKNFMALQGQFDNFNLFDNRNRPQNPDGSWPDPAMIMKSPPKPPKILDKKLFNMFKKDNKIMEMFMTKIVNPLLEAIRGEKPPAARVSKMAEWYIATARKEAEQLASLPKDFKIGEGIEQPLND